MTRSFPRLRRTLARTVAAALLGACALPAFAVLDPDEKSVLLDLYNGTAGAGWTRKTGWDTPASDPCATGAVWYGLVCDAAGEHVIELRLYTNNLVGTLPTTLNKLTALQEFHASENQLSGTIPNLTGMTALEVFYVGSNNLVGPIPNLTGLTALRDFYVFYNQLSGPLPTLAGMTALEVFHAHRNQLSGAIPSLAGLAALRDFYVGANQLTGSLPSLTGLTALEVFHAGENQLTGAVPSLTGLTNLRYFRVDNNQLTGAIPDLTGLRRLDYLVVNDNQLTGAIPSLAEQTRLRYLYAHNNQLTGAIPSLSGLRLEEFEVNNNQLTGSIPSLAGLTRLERFDISDNELTGPIPSLAGLTALEYFAVSDNQLIGPIPSLAGLTALVAFYVSNNQLSGTPPAAPAGLLTNQSALCPNLLHAPSPTEAAWNTATGGAWFTGCTPGYLVSPSAGPGGSVGPAQGVVAGATATIDITPNAGQLIDAVTSTCGGTLAGNIFTTGAVNSDCTVQASFRAAAPGAPGAVTPVPTLGEWSVMLLGALAAGLGVRRLRRRPGQAH